MDFRNDPRFKGIESFDNKVWLSSPTMHGDEQGWVDEAIRTNWVFTVGANIGALEKALAEYVGLKHAIGLSCGNLKCLVVLVANVLGIDVRELFEAGIVDSP